MYRAVRPLAVRLPRRLPCLAAGLVEQAVAVAVVGVAVAFVCAVASENVIRSATALA